MELDEAIRRRRMCRDFSASPLPPEVVDRLLDRARRAPSAGHTQGWAFVVLAGRGDPRVLGAGHRPGLAGRPAPPGLLRAPVVVVPLVSPGAYLTRYAEADKARLRP